MHYGVLRASGLVPLAGAGGGPLADGACCGAVWADLDADSDDPGAVCKSAHFGVRLEDIHAGMPTSIRATPLGPRARAVFIAFLVAGAKAIEDGTEARFLAGAPLPGAAGIAKEVSAQVVRANFGKGRYMQRATCCCI